MNEQAEEPKKRKRRWLGYSLKTFLLLLTGFAVWLGLLVHRVNGVDCPTPMRATFDSVE